MADWVRSTVQPLPLSEARRATIWHASDMQIRASADPARTALDLWYAIRIPEAVFRGLENMRVSR
jgi:hypothetical protein